MQKTLLISFLLIQAFLFGYEPSNIDSTYRPQDDFYGYSCGTWIKNNVLPEGARRFNLYSEMEHQVLINIAQKLSISAESDEALKLIENALRTYYRTGIDGDDDTVREMRVLNEMLTRLESSDVMDALAYMSSIGVGPLFYVYDPKRWEVRGTHYLCLRQPDEKIMLSQNERDNLERLFLLSGYENEESHQKVAAALRCANEISAMLEPEPRSIHDLYNEIPAQEAIGWFQPDDFGKWFDALGIDRSGTIIMDHPVYFKKLAAWLLGVDREELADYFSACLLMEYSQYLHGDFKKQNDNDSLAVVRQMMRDLPEFLNEYYLYEIVGDEQGKLLAIITENIRKAWLNRLEENDWMGWLERKRAREKLTKMVFVIGGESCLQAVRESSCAKEIAEANPGITFIETALIARRWRTTLVLSRIGNPWDFSRPKSWSYSLDCYYSPGRNNVVIAGGNLQWPFFDKDGDPAINYSGIAATIGHEISHAIDSDGRQYNIKGRPLNWLQKLTLTSRFEKRSQPLIDQYDHFYAFDDCHVDGSATLSENLADLGGVLVAYDAMHASGNIDAEQERRFFISYAQKWKELITEEAQRKQCRGPHSPTRFRAIGPLQNMDAFYDAFDIEPGDPMYLEPSKRVHMW